MVILLCPNVVLSSDLKALRLAVSLLLMFVMWCLNDEWESYNSKCLCTEVFYGGKSYAGEVGPVLAGIASS